MMTHDNTQHVPVLSVLMLSGVGLTIVMLKVVMVNVFGLSVIMLKVVMWNFYAESRNGVLLD